MSSAGRISADGRAAARRSTGRRRSLARRRRANIRATLVFLSLAVVTALSGGLMLFVVRDSTADSPPPAGTTAIPPAPATAAPSPAACTPNSIPASVAASVLCPSAAVPYSHSWYVTNPDDMAPLGALDGKWLSQQTAASACAGDFLTVLDFGHPTRKFNRSHASPLDDYAMTLFGVRDDWRTYREIEQLAETYLDAWVAAVSPSCPPGPRLHLVLGTSNFAECQQSVGACDVATAGQYWDVVVHDVMDYVAGKGYDKQVSAVWAGDDVETSWDPWATTARFLNAIAQQESTYSAHARMVNYGDANTGVCSVVTRSCRASWTAENVYDASWGLPWTSPLPEVYSSDTAQRWDAIAQAYPAMQILGVMTECAGMDPLPAAGCQPDHGADPSSGPQPSTCEWAPATAHKYMQANDPRRPLTYATNIQWPHHTDGDQAGAQPSAAACTLDQPPSNRGQSPS